MRRRISVTSLEGKSVLVLIPDHTRHARISDLFCDLLGRKVKAMYKLEPIIADGGELIIHGPQIRSLSFVHGEAITRIGYHVVE